jgi:hypothetical protein
MSWEVEYTDQFGAWWDTLDVGDQEAVFAAVELLRENGPTLFRPLVDTIHHSRHANMKELRPTATSIRVLFAFDPRCTAILLIAGNKARQWTAWYERMIPVADALYDQHLATLRAEGLL